MEVNRKNHFMCVDIMLDMIRLFGIKRANVGAPVEIFDHPSHSMASNIHYMVPEVYMAPYAYVNKATGAKYYITLSNDIATTFETFSTLHEYNAYLVQRGMLYETMSIRRARVHTRPVPTTPSTFSSIQNNNFNLNNGNGNIRNNNFNVNILDGNQKGIIINNNHNSNVVKLG